MSVLRQQNWQSQQRVDIPHLRSIESAVAADFDLLAGNILGGKKSLVVSGFTLSNVVSGGQATALELNTAAGIAINYNAEPSGSMLVVPEDRLPERLNSTNGKVAGGWVANSTNYLGIIFEREVDSTTTDLVQFIDPNTEARIARQIPLAKTLDYKIVISTVPFSSQPGIVPIATVVLGTVGQITGLQDARPLLFRLGSGGDVPNNQNFFTGWSRKEFSGSISGALFGGGDKTLVSHKDWLDAAMTRIWEIGGGEYWYSATSDRNVQVVTVGPPPYSNGEYFTFDGTTLQWSGLRILHDNSTAYSADIATGSALFPPGSALYVDLDRSRFYAQQWVTATVYAAADIVVNNGNAYEAAVGGTSGVGGPTGTGLSIVDGTVTWKYVGPGVVGGLQAAVAPISSLGTGSVPGSRWILAVRRGASVFVRGWRFPVGTLFTPATTTALGVVQLNATPGAPLAPVVPAIQADGSISVNRTTGAGASILGTSSSTSAGAQGIRGELTNASTTGQGVRGIGYNGVIGTRSTLFSTAGGAGVFGESLVSTAPGVLGINSTTGVGVRGEASAGTSGTGGTGVQGVGGERTTGNGGEGGRFTGGNSTSGGTGGVGVVGVAGTGGSGAVTRLGVVGEATGGASTNIGVRGLATGTSINNGVFGEAAGDGSSGVLGTSGGIGAAGVRGTSTDLDGFGVVGTNSGGGTGVFGESPLTSIAGVGVIGNSAGDNGTGVSGTCSGNGINSSGVSGFATGTDSSGVRGSGVAAGIRSLGGGMVINTGTANDTYRFSTTKTGVVIVSPTEFIQSGGTFALGVTGSGDSLDTLKMPWLRFGSPASGNAFAFNIKLPRGATLTDFELLCAAPAGADWRVELTAFLYSTSSPYLTQSTILNDVFNVNLGAPVGNVNWRKPAAPITAVTLPRGLGGTGNSGYVHARVSWVASTGVPTFYAARATYTYTEVDFMI